MIVNDSNDKDDNDNNDNNDNIYYSIAFYKKVVCELPFLLHQNCLHIKEHFFKKVLKNSVKRFWRHLNITKY